MKKGTPEGGGDLYRAYLTVSGDAIARFELDEPLSVDAPEDEQVDRLAHHSRIAECNDIFAQLYDQTAEAMEGRLLAEFMPRNDPGRFRGFREFVRARYRLVQAEEMHTLSDTDIRWVSGSALGVIEGGQLHSYWLTLTDVTERKRAEEDRARRGRILEAVAFGAARLVEPGPWRDRADEVLARLGQAAEAGRVYIGEALAGPGGTTRIAIRFAWATAGLESPMDDPRLRDGFSPRDTGLSRLEDELRAGRPVVTTVEGLAESEQPFLASLESKSLAAVPIFANGVWWGLLGFGETRYVRQWSSPEVECLKAAAAVFGTAIERETADAALRESEERFRRLASATFEGIAVTEAGVFLDANDQLGQMLGCRAADLIGQVVEGFVPTEDHEILKTQRQSGSEEPYEHRVLLRDGSVLPVEVRARHTPYQGRTVRVTAIRDLSSRKQAEERQRSLEIDLRQAAEQWRQTFDALDLGIVLADAEGQIVRLNRAALEEAKGAAFSDAVGRNLEELKATQPWGAALDLHRQVGEARTSLAGEARDPSSGRAFYLLASPWFRPDAESPWRVVTFRDVTAFITLENQLRRARTLEAMGSLVAGVAHEVRNPLFSISATVDALESELGPRPEFAEYASLLRSQVGRLTQLMRDLLDFGKPSLLQRTPTRLPEVLRRAIRSCVTLARDRRVLVEEHLEGEVPPLEVDGSRVEQALENLLANAIQHAPPGSVVRARLATIGHASGRSVRLCVEDDGLGIPEADLPRIFEPFFSRRKGGTGLGLSIVQRVAEAHGGSISAENRRGGGASFILVLPVNTSREGNLG